MKKKRLFPSILSATVILLLQVGFITVIVPPQTDFGASILAIVLSFCWVTNASAEE